MVYGETSMTHLLIDIQCRIIALWTIRTDAGDNENKLLSEIYKILRTMYDNKKCKTLVRKRAEIDKY